jgi:predicted ATP-grasp superfamily ATP-dependent carboligase
MFISSQADIEDFSREASFPCLNQTHTLPGTGSAQSPRASPFYCEKLSIAESPAELIEQYKLAAQIHPEVVAQEIIQGPDTAKLVYLSCYAKDGRRLGSCLLRQVRTMPINFGSASVVEPNPRP